MSMQCLKRYIAGDFNIDLLKINRHNYYNILYENIILYSFLPKITRPTRLSDEANILIDNIVSNNVYSSHTSSIITPPMSDHLIIVVSATRIHAASNWLK